MGNPVIRQKNRPIFDIAHFDIAHCLPLDWGMGQGWGKKKPGSSPGQCHASVKTTLSVDYRRLR
jgi:hypothetical protein